MQPSANTTNQPSGGLASVLTEPLTERDLDYSRLERTVDRYQLLLLAKRVGKQAGFTPRMLQLLEYYMAYTTAKDWEEGGRPIVFQSLARTAMDLGVGERQVQKLEKRLFDVGAICWNDSGNHKRFGRRDPKSGRLIFAYGVDLTPLAYLQEELTAKLHEKQLYAEAWRETKRAISQTRRQIRERLQQMREEGTDPTLFADFEERYTEIAYELRSHIDLARLRDLAKCHTRLLGTLSTRHAIDTSLASTQQTASAPIAPATPERSRSHARKFAHQEQTNTVRKKNDREDSSVSQDESSQKRPNSRVAIGIETTQQLARCAGYRFREQLSDSSERIGWSELIETAYRTRPSLGISLESWRDACRTLGRRSAALCLLLTDRKFSRTDSVGSSAAYFRGMTHKGRLGELCLQSSLLALRADAVIPCDEE